MSEFIIEKDENQSAYLKGRGAQFNPQNKFQKNELVNGLYLK